MVRLNSKLMRQLRAKSGLSTAQLAKLVGVDRRTLQAWECGEDTNAQVHRVYALAKHYGLTVNDLLVIDGRTVAHSLRSSRDSAATA